jgi:hypothetical protein
VADSCAVAVGCRTQIVRACALVLGNSTQLPGLRFNCLRMPWWVQEGGLSVGTETWLRRVMGYAGAGLGFLACMAWALVTAKMIVLSSGGLLVAAVVSVVGAAWCGAELAGRLKSATRLRTQGRITDATIVSLRERYVSIPSGFNGWVTTVKVSFTDASGHLINAGYTGHERAEGKREGQTVQIVYDPSRPVSISPMGDDPRVIDAFSWAWGQPSWRE